MKVAISYVSVEEAQNNMKSELPAWNFDEIVKESAQNWDAMLGRIDVEGGTAVQQQRFYTDLFHALQGRRIVSDVSGTYIDNTGAAPLKKQVKLDANGKPAFNMYNSDSFWGAQWSLNTLWHLVYPEITEEFINCMLQMYDDGGLVPRGPSGGNYTYVMTGAATTPFITSAYLKGIKGFDINKAYEGIRKDHFPGGMMSKAGYEHTTFKGGGIEEYMALGYVPFPLTPIKYGFHQDGAAQTLEYAYQDYALAQMAKVLNKKQDYDLFSARANNYKNLFNKEIGWMWSKNKKGEWNQPIDILDYEKGWVEGNAAQYTWFVPHDVPGLINLMGGNDAFTTKLNESFTKARVHNFVSGKSENPVDQKLIRRVYLNYGNQPCMQTPFLFNYAGKPWLTQYWTRQLIDSVYAGISPQKGYSGDEDQGLMGSLAVLLKIGLFSTDGGTSAKPFYEMTSPLFDKITIQLNSKYYPGKKVTIQTKNNGPNNIYIQSTQMNGKSFNMPWIMHDDLIKGGLLEINMGATPNTKWGIETLNAPVSTLQKK
jgi:predicted alpha-1,2-mannosidase